MADNAPDDFLLRCTSWERCLHFALRMLPLYKPGFLRVLYESRPLEDALRIAMSSVVDLTTGQYQTYGALHKIWEAMPDFAKTEPLWEILLMHRWFAMMPIPTSNPDSASLRTWCASTMHHYGVDNTLDAWSTLYEIPPLPWHDNVVQNVRALIALDLTERSPPPATAYLDRFPNWQSYLVTGHSLGIIPTAEDIEQTLSVSVYPTLPVPPLIHL